MIERWGAEQVLALAPDAASAAAGRKLSAPGPWGATGCSEDDVDGPAVWGECQGSGKVPYQAAIDLDGPAYRCSCPSRKFPCKHALGLLLLWSGGGVTEAAAPEWVTTWTASRREREQAAAGRAAAKAGAAGAAGAGEAGAGEGSAPADPEAALRRAEQRAARVAAGLDDLDVWLADQVGTGTVGLQRGGYAALDQVAARLVDAQAPGVASAVRRLPTALASGEGWPGRVLAELAALRLTVAAHRRLAELPEDLAATVRGRVGYPVAKDDVLAGPGVRDEWQVLALRDEAEDRLVTRRVWLVGRGTGRAALVLSFAPPGQPLDASLVPGSVVDADLHFYPGAHPQRALPGTRHAPAAPLTSLAGLPVAEATGRLAEALARDPWTASVPVVLGGVVPVPAAGPGGTWWLTEPDDPEGHALPLAEGLAPWVLVAVSGGRPVPVAVELTRRGAVPLAVHDGTGLVPL